MNTFKELNERFGGAAIESEWRQHSNGGGWLHLSATVSERAFVGPCVVVRGGTILGGTIRGGTILGGTIRGGTILGGTIRGGTIEGGTVFGGTIEGGTLLGGAIWGGTIRGGTVFDGTIRDGIVEGGTLLSGTLRGGTIAGGTWDTPPLFISGSRHTLTNAKPGHVQIGCRCETFAWWLSKAGKDFAKKIGYSAEEIKEYRAYILLFKKVGK